MRVEDFVSALRAEHIDVLVSYYARTFSERPVEEMRDLGMRELADFWKSVDEPSRAVLAKFIRLGSQNTMASVLAVLDNTSSQFVEQFSLVARAPDGKATALSQDLLDTFWAQEGTEGHVNRRAT